MRRRQAYNPKRSICAPAEAGERISTLVATGLAPQYTGNPEHKRHGGDFKLTPAASARPNKTLCDSAGITRQVEAERYLLLGFSRGCFSKQQRDGWPQNIWAVTDAGHVLESQHEGAGRYRGYPLQEDDPFRIEILTRWKSA